MLRLLNRIVWLLVCFLSVQFLNAQDDRLEYSSIVQYTSQEIKKNPNDFFLYKTRADAKYGLKDYQGAIADYDTSIQLNSDNSEAFLNRGNAFYQIKKYTLAEADFRNAVKLNPNEINAYIFIGIIKQKQLKFREAIDYYSRALNLNYSEDAMFNRGLCYKNVKKYSLASRDFENVLARNSGHVNAVLNKGLIYLDQKMYTLAKAEFEKARKIDKNNPEVYKKLAIVDIKEGKYNSACINLMSADSLGADNVHELIKKWCNK